MKININSAVGSPNSPRTWSGTPYNIYNELKRQNKLERAFEPLSRNIALRVLRKVIYLFYNNISSKRNAGPLAWRLIRESNASECIRRTKRSNSKHTLHFGTLSLPFRNNPSGQYHYLYTDGSWNLWSKYSTQKNLYSQRIVKDIDLLEATAFNQVSHIFSVSEYVKENLITHYNISSSKITVVGTGSGVIKPFFGDKHYDNGKILFAAKGRFADKGGDLVLKAFYIALEKMPNLEMTIVGQNDYATGIKHSRISCFGFVSIDKLQELFNTHSLFLMPALNEPWGLVYIEAMLCKMPIVGLNRNGFPELSGYGKYGVGVDIAVAEILAGVIVDLFSNVARMSQMGREGQEYAISNFTWEKTVRSLMNQIEANEAPLIDYK